jgi:hypothetical protein
MMFVLGMFTGILLVLVTSGAFVITESKKQTQNKQARHDAQRGTSRL